MDSPSRAGKLPNINAQKVAFLAQPEIGGNLVIVQGETSVRLPVHRPPRNLPERQTTFAGREDELREIDELLCRSDVVGITQQAAVHGHGGIGKSSLAIEYAWRHLDDYPGGLFFLSCEASAGAPPIDGLASHLGLPHSGTAVEMAARVKAHLETGEPCLLILDNVRDADQIRHETWAAILPTGACRRLITTRAEKLLNLPLYRLGRLSADDGLALLAGYRPDVLDNSEVGGVIVEWFDGLAVGLIVVSVYMQMHPDLSWEAYAKSLEAKGLGAVRATEDEVGGAHRYDTRVDSVFDDVLESLPPAERRALEYASLLPEDNIYRFWLPALLKSDGVELPEPPGYEGRAEDRVVRTLEDRELLRRLGEDGLLLSLHRVLRRRVRERLVAGGTSAPLIPNVAALAKRRGLFVQGSLTERSLRPELAPLAALAEELRISQEFEAGCWLANHLASLLQLLGRFSETLNLIEPFITDPAIGQNDEATLSALLSNSASALRALGRYADARQRIDRSIELAEKSVDSEDPILALRYGALVNLLLELNELDEAKEKLQAVIRIMKSHFGPDHPLLAVSYSNLAVVLKRSGDLENARRWMTRAIELEENHYEPDHPTLAVSYSNLGTILMELGELDEATKRFEHAIQIEVKQFGPNFPMLGVRYSNLAHVYLALQNTSEACRLFQLANRILLTAFDAHHPYLETAQAGIKKACGE